VSNQLNPPLRNPLQAAAPRDCLEYAQALLNRIELDPAPLLDLTSRPIVLARQLDRAKVLQLCRLTAFFEITP
jgi:hypothetical protein